MEKKVNTNIRENLEEFYAREVWTQSTLGQALTQWAASYADSIALTYEGVDVTYRELEERAKSYANGLLASGIKEGECVVVQLPNSPEFVALVLGMCKVGVIPIFALPAQRKLEISGILKASEAVAYVIPDQYLGYDYRSLAEEVIVDGYKGRVIVSGDAAGYENLADLEGTEGAEVVSSATYSDVAFYLLSGGTTGVPKLIPRRHGDYLYMSAQIAKRCRVTSDTVYMVSLPMAHNFPWGCPGVIGTLQMGGRVVISSVSSPDEILGLIEEEGVTLTAMVPVLANMCVDYMTWDAVDVSSLEAVQIGGSVLDPILAKKIEDGFGCVIQQVFGIAEGLICTTRFDDDEETRIYKQGTPVSTYDEVKIVDEDGREVADGEFGHLITRGPYTIYGYGGKVENRKPCIDEECYFLSGDRARKCPDGNYQVVGRLMEMINRGGEKIDPTELEELLKAHPDIEDIQVVGVRDEALGERICAFVKGETAPSLKDIRTFLGERAVAAFKLPDQVKQVDMWPLTNVGKIDRKQLKILGERS